MPFYQGFHSIVLLSGNERIEILLPIHILAGIFVLLGAALSVLSEKGKKLHVLPGKTFFWSMVVIFSTAIPMSIISRNIFLSLIAVSYSYLFFLFSVCEHALCQK